MKPIDILIVGGGPSGLAAAIQAKRKAPRAAVVLLDKAARPGRHSLSGAAFESACLDELVPGWSNDLAWTAAMPAVERDEIYFLTARQAIKVPSLLVPSGMRHKGDRLVSVSQLCEKLAHTARSLGVEIVSGFAARQLVWDGMTVRGVRLVDQGLAHDGSFKCNFAAGETVLAAVTIIADGSRGVLSNEFTSNVGGNRNPQVYSIGIKQVFKLSAQNTFGNQRVVSTLGFPNRQDVFGGGFFYSMPDHHLAAGLILGLDWKYTDVNPQTEFELLKTHPAVRHWLKGAELVSAGAKTIPEGGYYALPKLWTGGAVLVGDAAGFVNMEKIKGLHCAILSGMAAAEAAVSAIASPAPDSLKVYEDRLEARGVMRDLFLARNYRQTFQFGLFAGAPLSLVQRFFPLRLRMNPDHEQTRSGRRLSREFQPSIDRAMTAALAGTRHREDAPAHISITDRVACVRCQQFFDCPCTTFCPTEVYRLNDDQVQVSPLNCVHCGTCSVKCPQKVISWTVPEGGEGPRYKNM